jgi:predicted peptidase
MLRTVRPTLRLVAFFFLTAACVAARKPETGFLNRTMQIARDQYRYQVFVPSNYDPHKKWPVVLFLHGSGERGTDGLLPTEVGLGRAIRYMGADFPFIVVFPQCRHNKFWNDAEMQTVALTALDQTIREFHGDPQRIYLTGTSMGGYGVWEIAARTPGKFAAYVPVCGGLQPVKDYPNLHLSFLGDPSFTDPYAEVARRIGKTPVWIFHGDADPTVPVEESRKMAKALKDTGGNVRYTEYPGVPHNSWDKAYAEPELIHWMMQQKLQR